MSKHLSILYDALQTLPLRGTAIMWDALQHEAPSTAKRHAAVCCNTQQCPRLNNKNG
jgi:hypothetical protein